MTLGWGRMRPADAGPGHMVLIVDDMEANRALLQRRLERCGYRASSVDSGPAALQNLACELPDIILLDYMMPGMNGIEVLRELRAEPATAEIPVVMVTARVESEATVEALEAGADDYVTKPIDFDVLRARMETLLSRKTSAKDLKHANAALDERVTRRSLAIADLEEELDREIRRRKALEEQVAAMPQPGGKEFGDTALPLHSVALPELLTLLQHACERFDFVFEMAQNGRAANLAQLMELKTILERAREMARG